MLHASFSKYKILPIPIYEVFVVKGSNSWSMLLKNSVIRTGFDSSSFFSLHFLMLLRVYSISPLSKLLMTFMRNGFDGRLLPWYWGKYLSI